jgi:cytochrome c553
MPLARIVVLALAAFTFSAIGWADARAEDLPAWAFPISPMPGTPPPDDGKIFTLPESEAKFTVTNFRDFFTPPDWYPGDHPAMPALVAHGAKPNSFACGFCHLPTGLGRPENAPIAGLPASYIVRQVQEMASGVRKSALPDRYPQALMTKVAVQAATDPGLAEAAQYFASLKPKSTSKVVEADTIPKADVSHWIMKKAEAGGTEPLGNRLVEVPDEFSRFLVRDGHLTYTAYVPVGSTAKGETLVKSGGAGTTIACAICHGTDLRGLGFVPPIAGRSPSYIARQLFDMRAGARNGEGAALMKAVVAQLSNDDIIAITAYVSSQVP